MRRLNLLAALLALSLVSACADDKPGAELEQTVYGACYRSFATTLKAWQSELGRVPEPCAYLDADYSVERADEANIPCALHQPEGLTVIGCTQPEEQAIYRLSSLSDIEATDASIHEWIHALGDCVLGDRDIDHLRRPLWGVYGADTIEVQAQADVVIGHCLTAALGAGTAGAYPSGKGAPHHAQSPLRKFGIARVGTLDAAGQPDQRQEPATGTGRREPWGRDRPERIAQRGAHRAGCLSRGQRAARRGRARPHLRRR